MANVEAALRAENERLRAEQAASVEILRAIASGGGKLDDATDAIATSAARLCDADGVILHEVFGSKLRRLAVTGLFADLARGGEAGAMSPAPSARTAPLWNPGVEAVSEHHSVQVPDVLALKQGRYGAEWQQVVTDLGVRTYLAVPLLGSTGAIGNLSLARMEMRPFSTAEIALAESFADQAVIAIENARLFTQLDQRNLDLAASLEQQTATAEVLEIISRSPGDTQPVFDRITALAVRLTGASGGAISLLVPEGDAVRSVARIGTSLGALVGRPIGDATILVPGTMLHDVARSGCTEQIFGTLAELDARAPGIAAMMRRSGVERWSLLMVPLLRASQVLGVLIVNRPDGAPFSEPELLLLEAFARQAVIAIENARLFEALEERNKELAESLEQQTATSEILSIISASPRDLQPVFQAVAERTQLLLGADTGSVTLFEGDSGHMVAEVGMTPMATLQLPVPRTYSLLAEDSPSLRELFSGRSVHSYGTPDEMQADAPRLADMWRRAGYERRTVLRVPLVHEGVVLGALMAGRADGMPFTDRQVALLETFAAQVVIAMQNTRLFTELELRNSELGAALGRQTAMSDVLQLISRSPTDVQPVFDAIVERSARLCHATGCRLWLRDGDGLQWVALWGQRTQDTEAEPAPRSAPAEEGAWLLSLTGAVHGRHEGPDDLIIEGPPGMLFNDHQRELALRAYERGVRAALYVPLRREGTTIGVLSLSVVDKPGFTATDISLVETFADQAVIAIENARLFDELQERNLDLSAALQRQTAVSDVLEIISRATTDPQAVLDAIVLRAAELTGSDAVLLTLLRDEQGYGVALCRAGQVLDLGRIAQPISFGQVVQPGFPAWDVVQTRGPVLLYGGEEAILERYPGRREFFGQTRAAGRSPLGSEVLQPLFLNGEVFGFLSVQRASEEPYAEPQVALLEVFARQAIVAMENARLFRDLQERNRDLAESLEQQTATSGVLQAISRSAFDLPAVLTLLTENAARLCHADTAQLARVQDDTLKPEAAVGVLAAYTDQLTPLGRQGPWVVSRAFESKRTVHVPDVTQDLLLAAHTEALLRLDHRTRLAVPLLRGDDVIGVLALWRQEVSPFNEREIALVETFADQAVIAMENARLFEEIQQKTRQLEEANAAKSQFLSTMSHELRTPLNAVIGYSELLREEAEDEGLAGMVPDLVRINAAGKHLLSLINNVLDISKIEAGKMELELQDFAVRDLLAEVEAVVPPLVSRNGNRFLLDAPVDLGAMHADKTKLRQCLLNLLSNAAKFTEQGLVTLAVHRTLDEAGDRLAFAITDTGIGMNQEQLGRLFQSFTQAESGTASRYGGTGLGLSLSREFARLMGGDITVESESGKGSTFTLTVPAQVAAAAAG